MHDNKSNSEKAYQLTIKGLVQGVGFRPFVFRLAGLLNIKGWIKNTNFAVIAHIQGSEKNLDEFLYRLKEQKPQASRIDEIIKEPVQGKSI